MIYSRSIMQGWHTAGLLALWFCGASAYGQAVVPPVPPSAPARADVTAASQTSLRLKFVNAPSDLLLDAYAEQTGRTLLTAPNTPKATVTLRSQGDLTQEEYLDAIETVLGMNGIALIREGTKFLRVVPNASARTEPMQLEGVTSETQETADASKEPEKPRRDSGQIISQMIQVKHLAVADAQKAVESLKHPYGQVHVFENVNGMLITDTAATVNRIIEMLEFIDKPPETREVPLIYDIRFAKASEIKAKLEEIIAQTQQGEKPSTVPQLRSSGPPGVVATPTLPGVIRAVRPTPTPAAASAANAVALAERGIISGTVKMVADDRTGKLIIISWPENKVFFDMVIQVLDVETAPDVMVRVFRLEYAKADEVETMLNGLIGAVTPPGQTKPGTPATGAPAAPASESAALKEYIERREAAASATRSGEAEKTKIGQLSKDSVKILSDKRTNSLLVMASRSDLASLEEIIKGMDLMLYQVMIEALIVSISLQDSLDTGVTWFQHAMTAYDKNVNGTRKPLFNFAGGGGGAPPPYPMDATAAGFTGGGLTYYFTYFDIPLDVVLKAISTDSRTRILESPVIHTTDNKEAKIDVSTEQYFYKGQTPTSVGGTIAYVPNVETRKVGLNLTVTPHINQKKFVLMDIAQKIDNVAGSQPIEGQGSWPIIASREMSASIGVRSGETIVLGGLSTRDNTDTRTKIPLLGDIPLLGRLFNSDSATKKREEILVFITPYVIDPSEDMGRDTRRLKSAMGPDGEWPRGWSGSKLGEPTRQERREMKAREKAEAAAAEAAARQAAEAKKAVDPGVVRDLKQAEQPWSSALQSVDRRLEEARP